MVGSRHDSQQPPHEPMTSLPHDRFCDEIVTQTGLLREVVAGAGLSATVPTAPDWALADLLRHIGGNLRAVEQAVRTGVPVTVPERDVPGHAGHRADAAGTVGAAYRVDGDLAVDAVDEFLDLLSGLAAAGSGDGSDSSSEDGAGGGVRAEAES